MGPVPLRAETIRWAAAVSLGRTWRCPQSSGELPRTLSQKKSLLWAWEWHECCLSVPQPGLLEPGLCPCSVVPRATRQGWAESQRAGPCEAETVHRLALQKALADPWYRWIPVKCSGTRSTLREGGEAGVRERSPVVPIKGTGTLGEQLHLSQNHVSGCDHRLSSASLPRSWAQVQLGSSSQGWFALGALILLASGPWMWWWEAGDAELVMPRKPLTVVKLPETLAFSEACVVCSWQSLPKYVCQDADCECYTLKNRSRIKNWVQD